MTFTPGGAWPAFPSWGTGITVNEWREIEGSAMSDNPPSVNGGGVGDLSYTFNSWGAVSIDTRTSTLWQLAGGGHNDQYSNCVMRIRCDVNSPVWEEMLASDAEGTFTLPNSSGWYDTDHPASSHLYYSQVFIEARNRAMRFCPFGIATSAAVVTDVDGFDSTVNPGTDGWDARHTYPVIPVVDGVIPSVKDAAENVYSLVSNNSVRKWTQDTNTWSQVNVGFPSVSADNCAVGYDTVRDRIGVLDTGATFSTFSISTGTYTARTITGAGAAALGASNSGKGMVYVSALDAYIVRDRDAGSLVFKIDAATFACVELSTSDGDDVPAASTGGVLGKWQYAPRLRSILYNPSYTSNVWALRVH